MFSSEKTLALKISLISFGLFFILFGLIIGSSYIYQRDRAIRDFQIESGLIDGSPIMREVMKKPEDLSGTLHGQGPRGKHGPRDVVVFDSQQNIIKNDFLSLDEKNIHDLYLMGVDQGSMELDQHDYIIMRKDIGNYTFFLFRDLSPVIDFHIRLSIIALIASGFALLVIYLLSRHLAHITIEPIRQHNRELESYSHNVSHELRTPLSVMRGDLELLGVMTGDQYASKISSIREEVTNMEHIIESLLSLAKPAHEDMRLEPKPIVSLTHSIIEPYESTAEIIFEKPKKEVSHTLDPELYRRLITNLLENAIKYRSDGPIHILLTKNTLTISNSVENNLTAEELLHLTEAFYQGDTSRHTSGYGLGLALVAKIVAIFGWRIEFRCEDRVFEVKVRM